MSDIQSTSGLASTKSHLSYSPKIQVSELQKQWICKELRAAPVPKCEFELSMRLLEAMKEAKVENLPNDASQLRQNREFQLLLGSILEEGEMADYFKIVEHRKSSTTEKFYASTLLIVNLSLGGPGQQVDTGKEQDCLPLDNYSTYLVLLGFCLIYCKHNLLCRGSGCPSLDCAISGEYSGPTENHNPHDEQRTHQKKLFQFYPDGTELGNWQIKGCRRTRATDIYNSIQLTSIQWPGW